MHTQNQTFPEFKQIDHQVGLQELKENLETLKNYEEFEQFAKFKET